MTMTFQLLTTNSNQSISIPKCTEVIILAKFPQVVYKLLLYDHR